MRSITTGAKLVDQVVEAIRDAILTRELEPGSLHSVYRLAEELGVSRTPVREAVLRLQDAGLVRFERNRGVRILEISVHDLEEVFQLRLMLEPPAAYRAALEPAEVKLKQLRAELESMRLAAEAADEDLFMSHDRQFHEVVLGMAGNERLISIVRGLRYATVHRGASTVGRTRGLPDVIAEHEPILAALESREPDAAASAMYDHVSHTGELLMRQAAMDSGDDDRDVPAGWCRGIPPPLLQRNGIDVGPEATRGSSDS